MHDKQTSIGEHHLDVTKFCNWCLNWFQMHLPTLCPIDRDVCRYSPTISSISAYYYLDIWYYHLGFVNREILLKLCSKCCLYRKILLHGVKYKILYVKINFSLLFFTTTKNKLGLLLESFYIVKVKEKYLSSYE